MGFDATEYGRLLNALRVRRGYKRDEFALMITKLGVETSYRSLGLIERGEQLATVDRHIAFCKILKPPPEYFDEAFNG